MRNELILSDTPELFHAADNGENALYINGALIPVSDWVGTGYYTYTVNGQTYSILKAANENGNWQLVKIDDYNYQFTKHKTKMTEIIDLIYPVGSIYLSMNSTNPSLLFGGTWVRIGQGRMLMGCCDQGEVEQNDSNISLFGQLTDTELTYHFDVGSKGGVFRHTLGTGEMPAHTHGSKSLTGVLNLRGNDQSAYMSASGIVSGSKVNWSGNHAIITTGSQNNPTYNSINVNATHEHNSVGNGNAHNNMPPHLVVAMWERTA